MPPDPPRSGPIPLEDWASFATCCLNLGKSENTRGFDNRYHFAHEREMEALRSAMSNITMHDIGVVYITHECIARPFPKELFAEFPDMGYNHVHRGKLVRVAKAFKPSQWHFFTGWVLTGRVSTPANEEITRAWDGECYRWSAYWLARISWLIEMTDVLTEYKIERFIPAICEELSSEMTVRFQESQDRGELDAGLAQGWLYKLLSTLGEEDRHPVLTKTIVESIAKWRAADPRRMILDAHLDNFRLLSLQHGLFSDDAFVIAYPGDSESDEE